MPDPAPKKPTGSEYTDAVREVLERAARSEAAQAAQETPRPSLATRGPVMVLLAVAFVAVAAWNVTQWRAEPVALAPQEAEISLDVSVLAAGQAVEAYREEHGVFPPSLQELGFPEGLRLEVDGEAYRIVGSQGPFESTLDSRQAVEDFVAGMAVTDDEGR